MEEPAEWEDAELSADGDRSAVVFCGADLCNAYKQHPDEVQAAKHRDEFCQVCIPKSRVCTVCDTRYPTPPWPHRAARWNIWGSDRPQEGIEVTHAALVAALEERMPHVAPE